MRRGPFVLLLEQFLQIVANPFERLDHQTFVIVFASRRDQELNDPLLKGLQVGGRHDDSSRRLVEQKVEPIPRSTVKSVLHPQFRVPHFDARQAVRARSLIGRKLHVVVGTVPPHQEFFDHIAHPLILIYFCKNSSNYTIYQRKKLPTARQTTLIYPRQSSIVITYHYQSQPTSREPYRPRARLLQLFSTFALLQSVKYAAFHQFQA